MFSLASGSVFFNIASALKFTLESKASKSTRAGEEMEEIMPGRLVPPFEARAGNQLGGGRKQPPSPTSLSSVLCHLWRLGKVGRRGQLRRSAGAKRPFFPREIASSLPGFVFSFFPPAGKVRVWHRWSSSREVKEGQRWAGLSGQGSPAPLRVGDGPPFLPFAYCVLLPSRRTHCSQEVIPRPLRGVCLLT